MKHLVLFILLLPGITLAETLAGRVVGITDGDTLTLLVSKTAVKPKPEAFTRWNTVSRRVAEMGLAGSRGLPSRNLCRLP